MELSRAKLFIQVAHAGSFAGAARDHHVDPSSISREIAAFEGQLGFRLFQRSTRRMSLTEAGENYLARIEPLVEEWERARIEVLDTHSGPSGTLRFTASVTFGQHVLLPLLAAFRERHPGLKLDGVFTDANLDLVAERIDLAVRLAPAIEGDLVATRLMTTQYRVVASPAYLERAPAAAKPDDLASHACLLFPFKAFRLLWQFRDSAGAVVDVAIRGDITLSTAGALRHAALAGLGPALLPDWLVQADIAAGRLIWLFPDHDVTATSFETAAWLVYPSRRHLPQKVRAMIDFLKEQLGPRAQPGSRPPPATS